MEVVKEGLDYSPLMIFPEGATTNGRGVLPFKRGAFESEAPVRPAYCTMTQNGPCGYWGDLSNYFLCTVLTLSSWTTMHVAVHMMPVFNPNEYLFTASEVSTKPGSAKL